MTATTTLHHAAVHHATTAASLVPSYSDIFAELSKLFAYGQTKSPIFTMALWNVELFLILAGIIFILIIGYIIVKIFGFKMFGSAFEKIKFKKKDIDRAGHDGMYLEVTIPKNSQATAFQVQQKILKTLHSVYEDPIDGAHDFTPTWYFFQKLYRWYKVHRSSKVFFTLQIWGQYPNIAFRLNIPAAYYDRIEKAIYGVYPGAEISKVDKQNAIQELIAHPNNFLTYGQSTIDGPFFHRTRTFKDASSDPVDSLISTMEGLKAGQFMVYNITLSPSSHFFNQIIHFRLEEEERQQLGVFDRKGGVKQADAEAPDLRSQVRTAMIDKMKSSLFQIVISYWTVAESESESRAKLQNIQSVLTQVNQKNMNSVKHKRLFTEKIEALQNNHVLESLVNMRPVLKQRKLRYFPLFVYENHGQIVSDSELYSLWHLPNLTTATTASVKVVNSKKLPASHAMRSHKDEFFVKLGATNFSLHGDSPIGIPTWEDMKKHVYILGGTGSGKSETLKTILNSIVNKETKTACLIVDPKNDFATDLLTMIPESRKTDVVYFNPPKQKDRPLSFPFFSQFSGEKNNDERIEFLISIMKRFVQIDSAYSWGPELENILRQLFATAYLLPEQSLSGLDMLLHDPAQIQQVMAYMPERLQGFWDGSILKRTDNDLARYLATTNNKIGKLLDYPEFTNIADRLDTKITFEQMLQTGKIFIANLGACSEHMKKYYSVYLTAHIAEAIFGQGRLPSRDRKPAVFVVDEFQRVASDIFETLFSEVRAFNTALVISNQFMGQLDDRIQKSIESNIATKIFMRTQSVDDAEIAEKILGEKVTVEDVINLPTGTSYMKTLVHGIPQEAMSIQIQRVAHESGTQEIEAAYIRDSMERYGTPVKEIVEKRNRVNRLYYTDAENEEFVEAMQRHIATTVPEETALEPIAEVTTH